MRSRAKKNTKNTNNQKTITHKKRGFLGLGGLQVGSRFAGRVQAPLLAFAWLGTSRVASGEDGRGSVGFGSVARWVLALAVCCSGFVWS